MSETKFVVLTTQRTGSTWLMDLLNQVPGTEGHVELFLSQPRLSPPMAGFNEVKRFCEYPRKGVKFRPFATWNYLDDLYGRQGSVGFKLMYSHLKDCPEILPYLAFRKISVVHLVRDNSLDVVISETLTGKLGSSHAVAVDKSSELADTTVKLDAERTLKRIEKIEANKRLAKRMLGWLPCPTHDVSYEDLKNEPATFKGICNFLNLELKDHEINSNLRKRQVLPRSESIQNIEEIRAALARRNMEYLVTE